MALTFYPYTEDAEKGSLGERVDFLMESAERYKAIVMDMDRQDELKTRFMPRDQVAAFNWDEIARVLRETRELTETSKLDKDKKANLLNKLAEIYEVLRAAKMPKLEAVRLALIAEANQLRSGPNQSI